MLFDTFIKFATLIYEIRLTLAISGHSVGAITGHCPLELSSNRRQAQPMFKLMLQYVYILTCTSDGSIRLALLGVTLRQCR
jgi:hypothetical protein